MSGLIRRLHDREADQLDRWFTNVELRLVNCGHFLPVEAPDSMAAAIRSASG